MLQQFTCKVRGHFAKPKYVAIFQACLIGLVAGVAAVLVRRGVAWLGTCRVEASYAYPALFALSAFGVIGGLVSGWMVQHWGPETTGSGIPQVKAALNKFPMVLNLRVAAVKLISGIIALGSGMPLGREGPTVQVGAGLAGQISKWMPTGSLHRRHLLAAGAGAGLAAAFNAPIAGVLFIVEELLKDVSGSILGTAVLACFVASVISQRFGGHALDVNLQNLHTPTSFALHDIPSLLILGALAGILGSLFNNGIIAFLKLNEWAFPRSLTLRVGLAGLTIGIITWLLPDMFRDYAALRDMLETGHATMQIAAITFASQFFLILVAYGSGAPGGLFAPALMLGASLGYMVGLCTHGILGVGSISTYTLAGMGAFFSAVARVPVTAIVIVFEMTNDLNLVMPLMITSIVAHLIAEEVAAGSVYDRILELSGIHLQEARGGRENLSMLRADKIMNTQFETLAANLTVDQAVKAFADSRQLGFPVIDQDLLIGVITQTDLTAISQRQIPADASIREIMSTNPVTAKPDTSLTDILHILNGQEIKLLPVVDGGKVVGMINISDVIAAELDAFNVEDMPSS